MQTKDKAVNLFKNLLKFDKVEVSDNPSKEIIWNKIEELRDEASCFDQENNGCGVFAVAIVWIGFTLNCNFHEHIEIMKAKNAYIFHESDIDGTKYHLDYQITMSGECINIRELAIQISEPTST